MTIAETHADRPPRRARTWRWLLALSIALLLLVLIAWLARGLLLPAAARFLDVGTAPQPADGVLVLAGAMETRPFVAAALVRTGYASEVLLTESRALPPGRSPIPPQHEIARDIMLVRSVPTEAIHLLPGVCLSTFDEANRCKAFLAARPDYRLIVVTNTYHTRRARWIFHQVLGDDARRLQFVSAPLDYYDEHNWWKFEESFGMYVKEYARLAFYLVRYGIWGNVLLAAAACLLALGCWRVYRQTCR